MNAVVLSIGDELLLSDILDTNSAHVTRRLKESDIELLSKVTIGDNVNAIQEVLHSLWSKVDVIISLGGLGTDDNDCTRLGVAKALNRSIVEDIPGKVSGAKVFGGEEVKRDGLLIQEDKTMLFCLPGKPRDMAYLLDTEVLPYLQKHQREDMVHSWLLLRTAGLMESTLEQQLADLRQNAHHQISFSSFAGQTDIGVWVYEDSEAEATAELKRLAAQIESRLGDQIYGREGDLLEAVVWQQLQDSGIHLAVAEVNTQQVLAEALRKLPDFEDMITLISASSATDLAERLEIEPLASAEELAAWCRAVSEQLLVQSEADIGLTVYSNFTPGGVQLLMTLASPQGISVMQRSFGGHPDNIHQWAMTLGLVHVRRWLLAHFPD